VEGSHFFLPRIGLWRCRGLMAAIVATLSCASIIASWRLGVVKAGTATYM
jgi:hypothetical protein